MLKRQEGNGAIGVLVTVALIAFVALWMWLAKSGKAPNVGMGVKIDLPVLMGGLLVLVVILGALFFKSKRSN